MLARLRWFRTKHTPIVIVRQPSLAVLVVYCASPGSCSSCGHVARDWKVRVGGHGENTKRNINSRIGSLRKTYQAVSRILPYCSLVGYRVERIFGSTLLPRSIRQLKRTSKVYFRPCHFQVRCRTRSISALIKGLLNGKHRGIERWKHNHPPW